jgi:murein DD-endopeptidase MepM/ murein hydrolase activator NlpD
MSTEDKKNKTSWLKTATKVVGLNPTTFEEKWSIQWKGYQVLSTVLTLVVLMFSIFYTLLAFTPLHNLLPKEVITESHQELIELYIKVEEHSKKIDAQEAYISRLQSAILGEFPLDSIFSNEVDLLLSEINNLDTSQKEVERRLEEEIQTRSQDDEKSTRTFSSFYLVDPIKGRVSQKFNIQTHPAIDIVAKKDEPIVACLEGVVVHSGYNDKDGWIIMIKHPSDLTSVYKHCSKVLKEKGDFVSAGDPIGIVGSSGTNSTGPHLHFELWNSNGPVNPLDYLSFSNDN